MLSLLLGRHVHRVGAKMIPTCPAPPGRHGGWPATRRGPNLSRATLSHGLGKVASNRIRPRSSSVADANPFKHDSFSWTLQIASLSLILNSADA